MLNIEHESKGTWMEEKLIRRLEIQKLNVIAHIVVADFVLFTTLGITLSAYMNRIHLHIYYIFLASFSKQALRRGLGSCSAYKACKSM